MGRGRGKGFLSSLTGGFRKRDNQPKLENSAGNIVQEHEYFETANTIQPQSAAENITEVWTNDGVYLLRDAMLENKDPRLESFDDVEVETALDEYIILCKENPEEARKDRNIDLTIHLLEEKFMSREYMGQDSSYQVPPTGAALPFRQKTADFREDWLAENISDAELKQAGLDRKTVEHDFGWKEKDYYLPITKELEGRLFSNKEYNPADFNIEKEILPKIVRAHFDEYLAGAKN